MKIKKALLWSYTMLLSLSVAVAGICLTAQCLLLYRSGDQPYSAESVANYFSEIAFPVYFCGIMVLLGIFLKPFLPSPKKSVEKNYPFILQRLRQTTDLSLCPQELSDEINKLHQRRRSILIAGWVIFAVCSAVFLVYGVNPNHFHPSEINASVAQVFCHLLPAIAIPVVFGIFIAYQNNADTKKEIELLKSAPADAKVSAPKSDAAQRSGSVIRLIILAIAIFLVVLGFFMGGTEDVLTKAVNICTECIGLG